jgi:hypothetical protein
MILLPACIEIDQAMMMSARAASVVALMPTSFGQGHQQPLVKSKDTGGIQSDRHVWMDDILYYVGMGHFAFVAGVIHQMSGYFTAYCDKLDSPPWVAEGSSKPATSSSTFHSAVFPNVACAEFGRAESAQKRLQH